MSDHYNRFYKEARYYTSDKSILYDAAANYGGGGYVTCKDLIRVWKDVEEDEEHVATITLEIEAAPATFHYYPSHPIDVVIVLDIKTNEIGSKNTTIKRVKKTLKTIAKSLWRLHPDSTISILSSACVEDGLTKAYHQIKDLNGMGGKEKYQRAVLLLTDGQLSFDQEKCLETAGKIKHPTDGNTLLFAIAIKPLEGSWLESLVTMPYFYKELDYNDTKKEIQKKTKKLLKNVFDLHAGSKVMVYDSINTQGYEYVKDSITIYGVQDGMPLKNYPSGPLPNVSDNNVKDGNITVDLGIIPFGDMSKQSVASIGISYQIRPKTTKEEAGHKPMNYETHIRYRGPMHFLSDTDLLSYPQPVKQLAFPETI